MLQQVRQVRAFSSSTSTEGTPDEVKDTNYHWYFKRMQNSREEKESMFENTVVKSNRQCF